MDSIQGFGELANDFRLKEYVHGEPVANERFWLIFVPDLCTTISVLSATLLENVSISFGGNPMKVAEYNFVD